MKFVKQVTRNISDLLFFSIYYSCWGSKAIRPRPVLSKMLNNVVKKYRGVQ